MNFSEVKSEYVRLYPENIFNHEEFATFDAAFKAAWDSFDFVPGAKKAEDIAQAMCECWQLMECS